MQAPVGTSQQSLYRKGLFIVMGVKLQAGDVWQTVKTRHANHDALFTKGTDYAYLAARRGRKDRLELRGGEKREGVLTGLAAIVVDEVPKLSGTMRLTD